MPWTEWADPNPTRYTSEEQIPAHIRRFEWWYKDLVSPRVGFWIEKVLENQTESWRTIEYLRQALRQEKAKSAALQSELNNYYEQDKPQPCLFSGHPTQVRIARGE